LTQELALVVRNKQYLPYSFIHQHCFHKVTSKNQSKKYLKI